MNALFIIIFILATRNLNVIRTDISIKILKEHTSYVQSLVVLPDDGLLASGSWEKTIRIWQFHFHDLFTWSLIQ